MTIKQALKQKNRLVQHLNELTYRLHSSNSTVVGNTKHYSASQTLSQIYAVVDELTVLKTLIHKANSPVYDKIFLMSELKSLVKNLKALDCTEGVVTDYYSRNSDVKIEKEVEINVIQKDNEIAFLQLRIDELQEELDTFNATTEIELPVEEVE